MTTHRPGPWHRGARLLLGSMALTVCAACVPGDVEPADLDGSTSGSTSAPGGPDTTASEPPVTADSGLPTEGLPTEARAELRRAGRLDRAVGDGWAAYQEALAESLRAHAPTRELRVVAGPRIIQMVEERAPADAAEGLTVSLRPLGRLESMDTTDDAARLTTCLWAPTVGFFVEATGAEAEGAAPRWVEAVTELRKRGDRWIVVRDARSGRTCPGEAP